MLEPTAATLEPATVTSLPAENRSTRAVCTAADDVTWIAAKSSVGKLNRATGPMVPPDPLHVPPSSPQCPAVRMKRVLPDRALNAIEHRAWLLRIAWPPIRFHSGRGAWVTDSVRAPWLAAQARPAGAAAHHRHTADV